MFIRSHMAGIENSDHPQGFDEGLWAISRSNHIIICIDANLSGPRAVLQMGEDCNAVLLYHCQLTIIYLYYDQ